MTAPSPPRNNIKLKNLLASRAPSRHDNASQFVAILSETPPDGTVSKLHTGSGHRKDGPLLALP